MDSKKHFLRFADPVRYQEIRLSFFRDRYDYYIAILDRAQDTDMAKDLPPTLVKQARACFDHATATLRAIHGGPLLHEKDDFFDTDPDPDYGNILP